jgi:putative inorganic carbon (HCO3(-)) transporter
VLPAWLDRAQRTGLLCIAVLFSAGYATWGLIVLLTTVIAEGIAGRSVPWRRTPLDWYLLAFLTWFLFVGYLSRFAPIAVGSVGLAAITIYVSFGVISRVVERDPRFLAPLLWSWLIGGAGAAALAIVLHRRAGAPAFTFVLGQNAVGTTALISLVVGFGLFLAATGWRRCAAGLLSVLPAVGLVVSYTRGAWIGAAIGLLVLVGAIDRKIVRRGLLLGLVLVGLAFIAAAPDRTELAKRVLSIPSFKANQDRVFLYRTTWRIIVDQPLFGTGLNTFSHVYDLYRLPGDVNAPEQPFAHNIFLNMAAEGGVVGMVVFGALVFQGLRLGWEWRRRLTESRDGILATAVLAGFVGMMTHQLFDGTLISVHLGAGMWLFLGILSRSRSAASANPMRL